MALPETRHRLERELFERAATGPEIFDFVQGGLLDGLWYWDIETDEEWYSPGFVRALGFEPDEVPHVASWWQQQIFPEDLELAFHNYQRHLEQASHPYDQIVRYRHKRGGTVWFRCHGLLLRDGHGRPSRMLGCHIDVTALKQAEERLRRSTQTDELITGLPNGRALRERCRGRLISTVSHNVSPSPLASRSTRNTERTSKSSQGAADRAMLAAKREGRHTIHVLSAADGSIGGASLQEIEADLWGALSRKELYFEFQPQRVIETGEIVGYEALMHWRSQTRTGRLSPAAVPCPRSG